MSAAPQPEARRGSSALYAARALSHRNRAESLGSRSRLVSNLRGLGFVVAFVSGIFAMLGHGGAGLVAGASAAAFVALVVFHARIIEAEDHARRLARVNENAEARTTAGWKELPDDGARFASEGHPYAEDLDLFGRGSVYQRLSVAHTYFGEEALARFLRQPAAIDVIVRRQEAVRALAPLLDDRQAIEALSLAVAPEPPASSALTAARRRADAPDPEPLLRWAEGEGFFGGRRPLVALVYALPLLTLSTLVLAGPLGLPGTLWIAPLLASVAVALGTREEADRVFRAVSSTRGAFLRYGPMFERIERIESSSALLTELRSGLVGSHVRPSVAMRRFEGVVGWFDLRHNGMIHPFANACLLWDAHCLLRLEAFQREFGKKARSWFHALGEVEALSSFAGLAFDEPSFAWPEVSEGPAHFEATGLGHPLLGPSERVTNDVSIGAPGHALLVTGSNMSGKSTHLRAMGLGAVLALAGAPVCAARLRITPLAVCTSIRISDSLARGVSHFYAEVSRLKAVLDATAGSLPVFFLLDEILHGTNSDERQVGARWVLAELLRRNAIGAVSTHDVGLCRLPPALMERVIQCHFRESVEEGRMTFDYRLRGGPVTGGNALRLMRLVGLDVPIESADAPES